ncbi:hypothetical protein BDP27DRAFT_981545 [Rhodocollybia butyracea]|uniref:Uncharacterized protein n=1 Tax=Rhodocollybia butyracea TaxID=206335 RepID=A0A9P5PQT9_9AGAR|nr:hypothetical protein BDP27DRAFT_981545 [Rhodocollybia butyracea]
MSRNSSVRDQPSGSPLGFVSPKQAPRRTTSLRLCSPKAVNIPIPPSLRQSPYLNSPSSPFQRMSLHPVSPNQEDEQWLQDTVPMATNSSRVVYTDSKKGSSQVQRVSQSGSPSSPPLVRTRRFSQVQTPSVSPVEQDYFTLSPSHTRV